jgi:hypothetical protein
MARKKKNNTKIIAKLEVDEYNAWACQEYNGEYSFVGGWVGDKGDFMVNWVDEEFANGKTYSVPKGPGGRFEDLEDFSRALSKFAAKVRNAVDAQDEGDEAPY